MTEPLYSVPPNLSRLEFLPPEQLLSVRLFIIFMNTPLGLLEFANFFLSRILFALDGR